MNNNLIIYPKRGFLNTEYKIRSSHKDSYTILFNGQKKYEGTIEPGETIVLPKLDKAGEYFIISTRTNEKQKICVEDALRLGSSDLKSSYIFDNFQYVIFVMKDRVHFYDPIINSYVYSENFISPNSIEYIGDDKLLFYTKHSGGTSISMFNTNGFRIEESIETGEILAHSKDFHVIYILDKQKSKISVVRTNDFAILEEFQNASSEDSDFFYIDKQNQLLYIIGDDNVNVIYIETANIKKFNKNNLIGITYEGFLIRRNDYHYEYMDLKSDSECTGIFRYNPILSNVSVEGLAIADLSKETQSCTSKKKVSYEDLCEEFAKECQEKMASGDDSTLFHKDIDWEELNVYVKFYPSEKGVYIAEHIEWCRENRMTYYRNSNRVSRPTINHRNRIIWISDQGYEMGYSNNTSFSFASDISVKDDKALFKVNSSLYLLLQNGEIISKISSKDDVKDFASKKADTEVPIIIEGEKLHSHEVVCLSNHKLIRKNGSSYTYYKLTNGKEWQAVKSFTFEEEKYSRAKMSPDGKYLVYSKGGNKYALYNIAEQTEETVFSGNFVDFDKTGNLLFMEDTKGRPAPYRELRIYDPITFQWTKSVAHHYTFVSPDGKLYAKTGMKTRYFNKITGKEITKEEYNGFIKEFNTSNSAKYSEREKENIKDRRNAFVLQNKDYFERERKANKFHIKGIEDIQHYTYPDFCSIFLHTKKYVVIGIVDKENELEIELNANLSWLNYVAFSYDNKYVGIVGKPSYNGYLKLVKINYNENDNSLILEREICDTEIAKRATWLCAFTKQGLFGAYDSAPNLYLIHQSDFEKFNFDNLNDYNFFSNHFRISGKSLLCFSPSGKLMALSNQGYEAKSLGGRGHIPSNDVYIYNTDDKTMLAHWQDQGERIGHKNITMAGFSMDDSKLMTFSLDGVIVVRNINELFNKEKTHSQHLKLALAS